MGKANDLVQGTLDLLILKTLSLEPMHGWAIAKRIEQIRATVLKVQQGSSIRRSSARAAAWIEAAGGLGTGRQAKTYSADPGGPRAAGARARELGPAVARHQPVAPAGVSRDRAVRSFDKLRLRLR